MAGLPAFWRSSGPSRPWSSELRIRCTSGSPSASTTVRSSSVSLPTSSSSTCLPSLVERSRTRRGKRRNTASTGIMRTCMTIAWRAWEVRVRFCIACERPGTSASAASASTWVRCRTSSPMKCISWSSRSASTRTVEEPLPWPPDFFGAAASFLGSSAFAAVDVLGTSPVSTAASLTASKTSTWATSEHGADHGGQLGVGALGDHPGVDLGAAEGLDVVRATGCRPASRRARRARTGPCRRARTGSGRRRRAWR